MNKLIITKIDEKKFVNSFYMSIDTRKLNSRSRYSKFLINVLIKKSTEKLEKI